MNVGLRIRFATIDDDRLAALSPSRWRRRADGMRFVREQRQELVAGGLLADMLSELGLREPFEIQVTPSGKPLLPGGGCHFNLSHSDGVVMCVLADDPVGCDVERLAPLDDELEREIGSIEKWTLKEAAFKCGEADAVARSVPAPEGYAAAIAMAAGKW